MANIMMRGIITLLLFAWLTGCGPQVDLATLPAVPTVDVSSYQPTVRSQLERARSLFDQKPANADANGELGKLYRVYRNYEAGEVLLRRARALAPRNVDWMYLHGEVLEQLADYQGVLDAMDSVLEREPDNAAARQRAARMRLAIGDVTGGVTQSSELVASTPEFGDGYVAYAQALTADGQFEQAAAVWQSAIKRFGDFKTAHYGLAQIYRRLGDTDRAADHLWLFDVVTVTEPPAMDPRLAAAFRLNQSDRALVLAAQGAKRVGDTERTLALLEQALTRNPGNLEARAAAVAGYSERSEFERAMVHAKAGLALNPAHAELGLALGRMHMQRGKLDKALEQLSQVVTRSPNHASALAWLGRVRLLRGDAAQAGEHFRAAIAVEPDNLSARRFYVEWLTGHASPDEAISALGRLAQTPALDAPLVLSTRAQLQARAGLLDEAFQSLDRGLHIARLHKQKKVVTKLENQRQRLALTSS